MSIIKNSYAVGVLSEKRIAHWLAAQIKIKMSVPQNITQYEGTKKTTTKTRGQDNNYVQVQ